MMTGTGTQADPYIVTAWDEFLSAIAESGAYVKLGADIDLNEYAPEGIAQAPEWGCISLDGDGHTITNLTYFNEDSTRAFIYVGSLRYLTNLNFTNMLLYGNFLWCTTSRTISVNNCKFSGIQHSGAFLTYDSYYTATSTLHRCSFFIDFDGTAFCDAHYDDIFQFDFCNIRTSGTVSTTRGMALNNSLFRGERVNRLALGGKSHDSVIDAQITASITASSSSSHHILINTDKLADGVTIPEGKGLIAVTSAQLRDAQYLSSLGFPIVVE